MENVIEYLEKVAAEDNRPEAGYVGKSMAVNRAMRQTDSGTGAVLADPKLIKERLGKGLTRGAIGTIGGGVLGYLAGMATKNKAIGTGVGGILGANAGFYNGLYSADKEYLKDKGIDQRFYGTKDMTPEAKKKYLSTKYKGGGYE